MDKLNQKHEKLLKALASLHKAISIFELFKKEAVSYNPHMSYEEEYRGHRDSMIQRFEYSVDLFWKYLKKYLEESLALPPIGGPKPIIRECYSTKILNENEAENALSMIDDRNLTSHVYIEEVAEKLSAKIPDYYKLIQKVTDRLV